MPFFGPSDGLSSFPAIVVATRAVPWRRCRQGFVFQAVDAEIIKIAEKQNCFLATPIGVNAAGVPYVPFYGASDGLSPAGR